MTVNINGSTGISLVQDATITPAKLSVPLVGRNLIVNGSCQVDQVNSGALVSPMVDNSYPLDNLNAGSTQTGKLSIRQITTSALNSLGSTHAIQLTVLSQFTPATGDNFMVRFYVEGLNLAHLQWGTANASPVSLQFKINASVSGTYSGAFRNQSGTRSYPFSFTVVANTPTLVKIENIPGETTGTWVIDNNNSLLLFFDLGSGATYQGTANAWTSTGSPRSVTGATNLVSQVNGSTLDITDVQLEKGSYCTTFERKLYDQVLRECQRYFETSAMYIPDSGSLPTNWFFKTTKCASPTITCGAAGYGTYGTTVNQVAHRQTTAANSTVTASARL